MLWMPLFLGEELEYDNSEIANMASAFEIGTMFGGIFLGFISDRCYSKRSPIGCVAIIISFLICFTLTFNYKTIQSEQLAVSIFFFLRITFGRHAPYPLCDLRSRLGTKAGFERK